MEPESLKAAEALAVDAARTHGIHVDRAQVQRALQDAEHGPAFAAWVNAHISSDNLLSLDEMALYDDLDKSGHVDRLAALHDLGEVQAFTEHDIRAAIDELDRSTAAITKQTESLRQQQDALTRMMAKSAQNESRRRDFEASQQRLASSGRKRIAAEVEDLGHSVQFRVSDLEQHFAESGTDLQQTVRDLLGSDDKLLASLQKLGWELDQESPEEARDMENLREICMRLIKYTVETIRTKLDRLYIESMANSRAAAQSKVVSADEVQALQEEVESLYSEILPVAQMSIEQQYLEPASRSTTTRTGNSLGRSVAAVHYINECLEYLLDRTQRLKSRVAEYKSHQAAAMSLINAARTELSTVESPTDAPPKTAPIVSPVRPRANTANSSTRRRSSGIQEDPIDALLHNMAISLPSADDASQKERISILAKVLSERSIKNEDVTKGAQESFEAMAVAHMDDMRRAIQLVRDNILADTPFGEAKLVDPEIEEPIEVLAQQVEQVKETLESAEKTRGSGKSEKREEIIKRWGT